MLPRYDAQAKCAKCGHNVITEEYANGKGLSCVMHCEEGEHIHRSCKRCGYWWLEAPLDIPMDIKTEPLYAKQETTGSGVVQVRTLAEDKPAKDAGKDMPDEEREVTFSELTELYCDAEKSLMESQIEVGVGEERRFLLKEATDEELEEALREVFVREAADKYREVMGWLDEDPVPDLPEIISRLWSFKAGLATHHPSNKAHKAVRAAFVLGRLTVECGLCGQYLSPDDAYCNCWGAHE